MLKLGDVASANSVAMVFLNTNAAAAGGVIVALVVARMLFGKADLTMALNGALAGLALHTNGTMGNDDRWSRWRAGGVIDFIPRQVEDR